MLASRYPLAEIFGSPDAPDPVLGGRTIMQIVPELQSGGAERTTIDVSEAICAAGARSLVASQGGRMVSELQARGGVWLPFPAGSKNPAGMVMNSIRLARILRDEAVDIVHARSRAAAWVACFAARQAGVKFVTTWHSAYTATSPIKLRYNSIMAAGHVVIANSKFSARRILALHPEVEGRIRIIPRGCDLRLFSPFAVTPDRVERLRAQWGVAPHERVVLLPARLSSRKGHGVLIEAAARLVASGDAKDLRIVLAGDAHSETHRKHVESQIARAGMGSLIRHVGYCDDMPAAYLAAAVAIAPSTTPEAFGRVGVEAQAMGVPVIISDSGAAPEIVLAAPETPPHLATGWRVPPGDPAALAHAIAEALNMQASARDEMMRRARENAQRYFSVEEMQRATLLVYRDLLA
jgi:glycosyltransferase involved in cell wall biosynthesis